MNTYYSAFLSTRRWTYIFGGLLLVVFAGFYFFKVSAQTETTEAVEKPAQQNLVNGRLAFGTVVNSLGGQQFQIRTANADGTGQSTVTGFPPASEPAWSPDGLKLAYTVSGSGISEIAVINADGTNQMNLTQTESANERNPSWSAVSGIAYERDNQIWIMNDDGEHQTPFPGLTRPSPTAPAWSADGTKLAFVSGGEIWKINANGTGELRVTTNATADTDPSWSPDGTKIVFGKGGSGIAVVNADGTNEMNLTTNPNDVKPAWSSDGTLIAFRRGGAEGGLYVMDASGANQARIIADTPGPTGSTHSDPAWQPVAQTPNTFIISGRITQSDLGLSGVVVNLSGTVNATATTDAVGNYQFSGLPPGGSYAVSPSLPGYYFTPPNRSFNNLTSNQTADFTAAAVCQGGNCTRNGRIAFVRTGEIFTIKADGTDQKNLTNHAAADNHPNYSPDGSTIAFTSNRDGNNEIYKINANGTNPVRLTNNSASDTSPYYSPDGASIVFVSNRDGNNEIYKMNSDGSNQIRLTNDAAEQSVPAYSPNGQKIIFVTTSPAPMRLWMMNADGSNQQQFPDPGQPGFTFYDRPSYSPDGSKIIFVYGADVTGQAIWTMNSDGTNRTTFLGTRHKDPAYSPDGTKVVYYCCGSTLGTDGIYSVNTDGNINSQQRISTDFNDAYPDWQPILAPRRAPYDFDGDGRSDISVFRPSNGAWYLLRSSAGLFVPVWGLSTDRIVPADYDGDLKTDVAVWRPSDGNFYILNSFDSTVRIENFGLSGDVPTGGDFDGDGKSDLAVYREGANSTFYYRGSMGNPNGYITFIPWGVTGDKPVVGDYDGDGRTDIAVFRPSNGTWYIRQSSNGQLLGINFGLAGDTLVPADYDGDGKMDIAVYRAGIWYQLRSAQGFAAFQFGIADDRPAPADFDGDGRADATVYRNGVWWILKSQSGAAEAMQFGLGDDMPVPAAFVR